MITCRATHLAFNIYSLIHYIFLKVMFIKLNINCPKIFRDITLLHYTFCKLSI